MALLAVGVDGRKHDVRPTLHRGGLEEQQQRRADRVEGAHRRVAPHATRGLARLAVGERGDVRVGGCAEGESACKELHAEDAEDDAEEEDDHDDVANRGERLDEEIDDEAQVAEARNEAERPQHAQHAQRAKGRRELVREQ